MAASIELKMTRTPNEPEDFQSYQMIVEVVNAVDISEKIFVMQRSLPASPSAPGASLPDPVDRFMSIADPVDLEEYPEDAPALDQEMPYYRVNEVTLEFRSLDDLLQTWEYIKDDVSGLVRAVNTNMVDPHTEYVTFPTP